MDLHCTKCGEPWDLDHVVHAAADEFDIVDSMFVSCPACPEDESEISESAKQMAERAKILHELLGDDVDGIAAEMSDLCGGA